MIVKNVLILRQIVANCRRFSKSAVGAENPYYAKYRHKLDKVAGNEVQRVCNEEGVAATTTRMAAPAVAAVDRDRGNRSSINLHDILQVEKIGDLASEQIAEIWCEYYRRARDAGRNELGAVLSVRDFEMIGLNSKLFPRFVFAAQFSEHFQFFYSEFAKNSFHFTPLLEYQRWHENAPVCLLVRLFDEFVANKRIALVRAEFDPNVVDADRAACLVAEMTAYYASEPNTGRNNLLCTFNRSPATFRHDDVIEYLRGERESHE